jgi:hypothetical protein
VKSDRHALICRVAVAKHSFCIQQESVYLPFIETQVSRKSRQALVEVGVLNRRPGPHGGTPRERPMKTIFAAAVFAIASFGAANAMPLAPLSAADTAGVIQVAQGCGPGWARGPYGRCRPMGGAVVVRRPPPVVVVRPGRVCPPGLVFRYGRCRPY